MYKNLIICAMALCSSICGTSIVINNQSDSAVRLQVDGTNIHLDPGSSWTSQPDWNSMQVAQIIAPRDLYTAIYTWVLGLDKTKLPSLSLNPNPSNPRVQGLHSRQLVGSSALKQGWTIPLVIITPGKIDYTIVDNKGRVVPVNSSIAL